MISLKEFVDMGGTIKIPYKKNDVMEWYSDMGAFIHKYDSKYSVWTPHHEVGKFDSFEEAWEEFEKHRFNIGVLQNLVAEEHCDDYVDVEDDPDWWRNAIEKKADELGVPRPQWKVWDEEEEDWV